jgi:hypothetical protein
LNFKLFGKGTKMQSNVTDGHRERLHFPLMPFIYLILACSGCLSHHQKEQGITLWDYGFSTMHLDPTGPSVRLYPLLGEAGVMAVIVRVASAEDLNKDADTQYQAESGLFYSNSNVYTLFNESGRNGICLFEGRARLSLAGHIYQFDKAALANGPWIYCFEHAKPPYRIQVAETESERFEAEVYELSPLEFVSRWCDPALGEPLKNGEFKK